MITNSATASVSPMNTTTSAPGPASVDRPKSSAAWASAGHTIAMNAAGAPRRGREETLFIRAMRMEDDVNEKAAAVPRSEEHTSELQSRGHLVCRLLLEKKNEGRD